MDLSTLYDLLQPSDLWIDTWAVFKNPEFVSFHVG